MKWFWIGLFTFLSFLVVSAAMYRPDTIDSTLAFTGTFLTVASWTLLLLGVAAVFTGGAVLVWIVTRRRQVENFRQRDGHYPLQRIKAKDGRIIYFDPNMMVGPCASFDRNGDMYEPEPAAGWQIQATVRALVERTRGAQAMFQGDASRADKFGSQHRGDRIGASALRMLDKPARAEIPALTTSAQPVLNTPPTPATLARLLDASTRHELAIGYQAETGELATWVPSEQPHLRIHGGTQRGKTSLSITLVAAMLAQHWAVVVLDRRSFKDWAIAASRAELVDTRRPEAFAEALNAVKAEYERREQLLGEHGAFNLDQIRVGARPPRLAVVLEEYGAQRVAARAAGCVDAIDATLAVLASEAAANGIHLIAIDQRPVAYHPTVKANMEPVVFGLPEGAGGPAGYWQAHKLPRFAFYWNGVVYRSVHAQAEFEELMARRSPPRYPALCAFGRNNSVSVPEVEQPNERPNAEQPNGAPTDLQGLVWAWRDRNPNGTQAEMRRQFAESGIDIARGYAHELWHKWPDAERSGL